MYLLLLTVPLHLVLVAVQILLVKKVNLVPLLWTSVVNTVLIGLLGSVLGCLQAFHAVAMASAEMKQALMAQGIAVSLYTTAGALMMASTQLFFTGIAASVVRTWERTLHATPEPSVP
jgi:biopolymer transport protein ExbB/TolQ